MVRESGNLILFLSKTILFFTIIAIFAVGQRYLYPETLFYFRGNIVILLLYTASLYLISRIYNGFNFGNVRIHEIIISWVLCLFLANGFLYLVLSLLDEAMIPVPGILVILAVQIAFVIPTALFINWLYFRQNPAQKAAIVYGSKERLTEYCSIISLQSQRFKIDHIISQHDAVGSLLDIVDKSESIFFLDVDEKQQDWLFEYCYMHNKHTYILPKFSSILINTASTHWFSNTPVFSLRRIDPDMGTQIIKRLMDIMISLAGIIITSLPMIGVWLAVRLYDNHPAIYKQTRVTRGGRLFTLYKFRSMRPDAEDDGIPRLTAKGDARITPIGRIIRKTRIDELPQLFNVLSGSMSIVGPRPERPEIAQQYEEIYPTFAFRTKVKAGITGFAQIYGRYNTSPEDKLFLDIMYIESFSILEDIKLILQTVKVIFQGSSTEGIEDGSTTALGDGR